MGAKKLLHLFGFSTTSTLNGEYLLNETRHRQSGKGVGKCEVSPTLSQNFTNFGPQTAQTGPEVLPTLTILLCHSPSPTLYAALTWRPTATLDEMALGSFAAKI